MHTGSSLRWRHLGVGALGVVALALHAEPPAWWSQHGVIALDAGTLQPLPADDFATANVGQLKHFSAAAATAMNVSWSPSGAGAAIDGLVGSWFAAPPPGVVRDDYAVLNQGQLKAVAELFYARLEERGYEGPPLAAGQTRPWTLTTDDDDAFAAVNLGQLKHVFSFEILLVDPPASADPYNQDSDGDGVPDGWEVEHGLDPQQDDSAAPGWGDQIAAYEQSLLHGGDPVKANIVGLLIYTP